MKNRYVLLIELPLIVIAAMGAFTARFDWEFYQHRPEFLVFVLAALVIKPVIFWYFGMYRRYWRYASIHDLGIVFLAVSAASLAMALFVTVAHGTIIAQFSRVVLFNDWLMTLATAGGLRLAIRAANDPTIQPRKAGRTAPSRRILIVGAGAAGTMVAREMRRNPQLGMEPAGFLDDDPGKLGKDIAGLRVFGGTSSLPETVRAHRIDSVIIAMPSARGSVVRAIVDACTQAGVKSQAIPGVYELLDGMATVSRLRNVEISDLLRRSPIDSEHNAAAFVHNRVVLITGGGGSIGYELARQVANAAPAHLVLLGHGENSIFEAEARLHRSFPTVKLSTVIADVRDDRRLAMVFDRVRPDIVFHAAAHKHVPLMEENPEEAVTNNVIGTRNVVNQALRRDTERLVFISTDKAVSPTSLMGATKRIAEMIVRESARASGKAFVAVRFGNVLGSRGSVVNTFKEQIELGGPVTITHPDMTRFFMTIPEAVHLVLQASGEGKGGELFVLDMGEPVKIVQLAQDLIKLSGLNEDDVPIVFTGTRTGEKLHEALFDAGMQTQPTSHPEILEVVGTDTCRASDLNGLVWQLEEAARRGDRAAIEMLLGQTIPGFASHIRLLSTLVTDQTH
jgi:FlaA1/EpsC-like NDP-sugar epimerase